MICVYDELITRETLCISVCSYVCMYYVCMFMNVCMYKTQHNDLENNRRNAYDHSG